MEPQKRLRVCVLCTLTVAAMAGALASVSCGSPETEAPPFGGSGGSATGGTSGVAGNGGTSSGGSPSTGGASTGGGATGGALSTGGNGGAGALGGAGSGSGGAGEAGISGNGGQAGSGIAGGGAGGTLGGIGGGGNGGGGASGAAGGGGKAPADPSAGCGKSGSQTGSSGSPLTVSGHQYYVKLPTGYDANKPYPTLYMFNPTGNPISWAEQNAGFESNGAKDAWIRVYPHPANSSSGWGSGDVSFFAPLHTAITSNFCVDQERVFAAGESSGGDFSSILGCEHADKVRAIGPCATKPVNSYPLDPARRTCTGQVAAVIIHGKNDNVVGPENGPLTRDFYRALNHCTSMSQPVTGYTDTLSNCVEFQGCDSGFPVFWCQHTDPEYSNTNHGWPRFAAKFLFEKFSTY